MLSDVWSGLSLKDFIVPLLAALGAWFAALRMTRSNEKIALDNRDYAIAERARVAKAAADDDLTARLKILMDSYAGRIKDLTAEIRDLTLEIHDLRARIEVCEQRWRMRDAAAPAS